MTTCERTGRILSVFLAMGALIGSRMAVAAGPAPLSPGFEPQQLIVPEGFTVELAAGPPLVEHPTFATFDDRGRLFLSENAGVNLSAEDLEKQLPNSIRMLEDLDGDGRFDKSTVFADKLTFPMGGAWHEGALYVASPPNIWRLQDTDGDGVADRRDVLVSKFGYTGNAADIHGCILGPDGRMYWCDGFHGHEFKDEQGHIASKREGSYLFSCLPNGSDVRIHCGGGMDNPVEVDFTNAGEMLGTVNILYTRPRIDCFVHWLYGGAYPHREKVLQELKVTGDLLGPVHQFGHVAVSGVQRYRSGLLDREWQDNFFATFFNSGKIARLELERSGSTFTATQREFLTCANREFHPTDIAEDADGSLLVVDTGGWFYRGCPTSQHAKPDILGGIYRIRRSGMPRQSDPRGNQIDWSALSDAQLAGLLGDARFAVRDRAVAACARRGTSIVTTLAGLRTHPDAVVRLSAIWSLVRIGHGVDLKPWLSDPDLAVRLAALHGLAFRPDPQSIEKLLTLLAQDEPPVRRSAATALGRSGARAAVAPLLGALARKTDRAEEHAIIYALIELNDPHATRPGLQAARADVRRGALISLDQMDAGDLGANDVLPLVQADDPQLQLAAAQIFSRHADWADRAAEVLAALLERAGSAERNGAAIRRIARTFIADPAVGEVIGRALSDPACPAATQELLLASLADGQGIALHESWIRPLELRLNSPDTAVLERTLDAVAAIKTTRFHDRLQQLAVSDQVPVLLRVSALQVASGQRGSLTDPAFDLLERLLAEGSPQESLKASQKLGASALSNGQLVRMAPYLETAAPTQLSDLIRPFNRSNKPEVAGAFLTAMKNARSLTTLAEHEVSDIIKSYPVELLPEANALLDRLKEHRRQQLARLDALLPRLKQGDARRGAELFFAEKAKCASCHRVGDKGGKIGPDLTTIGSNRAGRDLIESIVFPSATIVRDYEPYTVATTDGRVFSGLIARETSDMLFIQQQTGDPVAIPRSDIEQLLPGTVSIMPNGLDQALTEQQLADVVAYLMSLKQPSVAQVPSGGE